MFSRRSVLTKSCMAAIGLAATGLVAGSAQAASTDAIAVGGVGLTTQVGNTNGSDQIVYFIPLSDAADGVYGVTDIGGGVLAGTTADSGSGFGYNTPGTDALEMFLYFDLSVVDDPAFNSQLTFEFDDLDLTPNNDPDGFLEDLQIQYFNSAGTEIDLTGTITDESQFAAGVLSHPGGNPDRIRLDFTNLTGVINDLQDANQDLYVKLDFSSLVSSGYNVTNTAELLLASALTTNVVVPVPAAAWMGMSLLGGMATVRRLRQSKRA